MKNSDYDKELRALGYVDSGRSGSRGDYFILSYRPGARKKHKLKPGLVEVHTCGSMNLFKVATRLGEFKSLKEAVQVLA